MRRNDILTHSAAHDEAALGEHFSREQGVPDRVEAVRLPA